MLGVLPASGGLAIYCGWLGSRNPIFWDTGLVYVLFCSVLVLAGLVLILILGFHYRWGLKTGIPIAVMLLDFPLALILVFLSTRAIPRVEVTIYSRSGEKIHDIRVSIGKDSVGCGALENGQTKVCYVYPERESEAFDITFGADSGRKFHDSVSCYVTNDLAGVRSEVEIGPEFDIRSLAYQSDE